MLIPIVVAIHVTVCLILIVLVLLHSGRGGGLSDMFGGMGAAAQGSTVMERNLDRITLVAAIVFSFTTISLGLLLNTNSG